jgi:hypothetical protein
MWLKAPIVEEREDGKKEYKGNDKGTPQGGLSEASDNPPYLK